MSRSAALLLVLALAAACGPDPAPPAPVATTRPSTPVSARVEEVVRALTDLTLHIEVRPDARYPTWEPGVVPPRLRSPATHPWRGLASEFDAYLEDEVARWRRAVAESTPYEPSRGDMFIAHRRGSGAAGPEAFAVLEVAPPDARFGLKHLHEFRVTRQGDWGTEIAARVRSEHQEAFERWTRRNVGLPLVILLNQEVHSAPTIMAPLREVLVLRVGLRVPSPAPTKLEPDADGLLTLPDLTGLTRKEAETLLREAGLVPIITLVPSRHPEDVGRILRQRPMKGERRARAAMIFLTVGEE